MESIFISLKKYLGYGLIVFLVLFAYQWVSSPMVVTVSGLGEVSAKAETAALTFTLSSNSDNPQSATTKVNESVKAITETLKTGGIPENDIFESQVTVYPASALTAGATGFQSTVSMGIRTSQINNLGGIIANLYSQGAVVVTQPVLSVGKIEDLEKEAYNLAIKDAKKKARSIAFSNWKILKKIVLIEQSHTTPSSTVTSKAGTVDQVEKNLSPDDGLIKISKIVNVSYKMW